jgi:hypothetical protein
MSKLTIKIAGGLLLAEVVLQLIAFNTLAAEFDFPDILRQPAGIAITKFLAKESSIVPAYYVFLLSSLVYIPLSYWLSASLGQKDSLVNRLLEAMGVTTSIFQSIGFVRWIFLMPYLAHQWQDNVSMRQMTEAIYELMNRYAGQSIGEHLGFILMASWTFILSYMVVRQSNLMDQILGVVGMLLAITILVSTAENFGGPNAPLLGIINLVSNIGWSVWAIVLGIRLMVKPSLHRPAPDAGQRLRFDANVTGNVLEAHTL